MVRKGDILYSPLHNVTVTFILTSADTAGMLLQLETIVAPGGKQFTLPMHVHPKQRETFAIKSGKVRATIGGEAKLYGPGEVICIPAGAPHKLVNASEQEELNFLYEISPALGTEILYETAIALAQSGRLYTHETIPLLQIALTLSRYTNHLYITSYPIWLQRTIFKLLSPVALLMGHQTILDYQKVNFSNGSSFILYD